MRGEADRGISDALLLPPVRVPVADFGVPNLVMQFDTEIIAMSPTPTSERYFLGSDPGFNGIGAEKSVVVLKGIVYKRTLLDDPVRFVDEVADTLDEGLRWLATT